jgi:hypothetical protein
VTAGDLAAVVLSVVMIAVIVAMALVAQALLRTLRELRATLDDLRVQAVPLMGDLPHTAESISATVDSASRLGYLAFRAPVIRTVAVGRGIGRGARRLVGRSAPPALGSPDSRPGLASGSRSSKSRRRAA